MASFQVVLLQTDRWNWSFLCHIAGSATSSLLSRNLLIRWYTSWTKRGRQGRSPSGMNPSSFCYWFHFVKPSSSSQFFFNCENCWFENKNSFFLVTATKLTERIAFTTVSVKRKGFSNESYFKKLDFQVSSWDWSISSGIGLPHRSSSLSSLLYLNWSIASSFNYDLFGTRVEHKIREWD